MMQRALHLALLLTGLLAAPAVDASQATLVTPGPPLSMAGLASFMNAALLSVGSCNAGNAAPANGPGPAAFAGECWINTTANPWVFSTTSDGVHWSTFGTLNTSTFIWTPVSNGFGLSLGGNLTTAAALTQAGLFPTTLTVTAATNATLPAGTHTLGGLDVSQAWSGTNNFTGAVQVNGNAMTFPGVAATLAALGVAQTWTANQVFSGTVNHTGPFQIGGTAETFPASGSLAGTSDTQVLTNKTVNCANNVCTVRLGSDVTGTLPAANFPALSGDVTTSAGSTTTTLANIPNSTPAAGSVLHANIAAPATPAAGKTQIYTDSTAKRLHDKNDAGAVGTTVVGDAGAANNFLTAIDPSTGAISKARPACASLSDASVFCNGTGAANLTGTLGAGQLPAFSGDVTSSAGSAVLSIASAAVTNAKLAASASAATIKGNPTAAGAAQQDFTIPGLTAATACNASTDFLIKYDVATATLQKVTCALVASSGASGVSSTNGLTGALTVGLAAPGGRLSTSLVSGAVVCVPTADVVAAPAIYYAPCNNPYVPIYDGTNVQARNFTSGVTDAVGLTLTLGSNWAASTLFDTFVTLNSGSPVLCTVPWTSSTAGSSSRATALALYNGMQTNGATATCRINNTTTLSVAANQGTYVGTFLTNSSAGQIDLKFGALAAGGGAAVAGIWNVYNQSPSAFVVQDSNATWSTSVINTYQPLDASNNNRMTFVTGTANQAIDAMISVVTTSGSSGTPMQVALGLNTTSAIWTRCAPGYQASTSFLSIAAICRGYGLTGLNFLQGLQWSGTNSSSYFGQASPGIEAIEVMWWW